MEEEIVEQQNPLLTFTGKLSEEFVQSKLIGYNGTWDQFSPGHFKKLKTHYNMYRKFESLAEGVAVKIPELFQVVETESTHLLNSLFGPSEVVDLKPRFIDPTNERTFKVKSYINHLIKDVCEGERKTKLSIKDMLIYGFFVAKASWVFKTDEEYDVINKQLVPIDSSHPDFYKLDPFSFAFDPSYTGHGFENLNWCRERVFLSKDKMLEMRENGECSYFEDSDMQETEDKGKTERGNTENKRKSEDTYYDEFWVTMYDKDEEGKSFKGEYIVWLLSNKRVIKFQKNPLREKPFMLASCYDIAGDFLGFGEAEAIAPISAQMSQVHYQGGLLTRRLGNGTTYVGPTANISPENLRRDNGGIIFLDNIQDIRLESPAEATNLKALTEYGGYLDKKMEGITGVNEYLQGDGSIGDGTAMEASLIAQSSTNRLANKLKSLQTDFVVPLARLFFKMNKELLELPVEFFNTNNQLINLTQEDFQGNYDFVSNGTVLQANKALQLQLNSQLIKDLGEASLASQQTPNPFFVDYRGAVEGIIGPNSNVPNIAKYLIIPDATQQQQPQPAIGNTPNEPMSPGVQSPEIGSVPPIEQMDPASNFGKGLIGG